MLMSNTDLIRFGGLAAIVAGILRTLGSVVPATASVVLLQLLYFLTDLAILFGIMGLYLKCHRDIGSSGLFGFLLSVLGILLIRSSNIVPGIYLYPIGALVFSIGLNVLGIMLWRVHALPGWVAGFWLISLLAGVALSLAPSVHVLAILAGLMFAAGFVGAGLRLRRLDPMTAARS
jgi:hypothetical protein